MFCLYGIGSVQKDERIQRYAGSIKKTNLSNSANLKGLFLGWKMGFEPTTNGTTIRYSNLLSYIHRLKCKVISKNQLHKILNLFSHICSITIFVRFFKIISP